MAKYCPINSSANGAHRCLGNNCSFSMGDGGCLFQEALNVYINEKKENIKAKEEILETFKQTKYSSGTAIYPLFDSTCFNFDKISTPEGWENLQGGL